MPNKLAAPNPAIASQLQIMDHWRGIGEPRTLGGKKMKTIASATKGLIGKLCWGVQWEHQLNMSISFGSPRLRIREPYSSKSQNRFIREIASFRNVVVKGEWWLWIYCAFWRIVIPSVVIAKSSSPLCIKRKAMARLNGQRLVDIRVDPHSGSTEFEFDLGAILQARPFEKGNDADVWTLYKPNGYVLGVKGNGTFTHARGTTPQDKLVPIKLRAPNQNGAAKGSQPIRSTTKSTPAAAGPRR